MTILLSEAQVRIASNSSVNWTSVCSGTKRLVSSAYLKIILLLDIGLRSPSSKNVKSWSKNRPLDYAKINRHRARFNTKTSSRMTSASEK
jgi:hypothetical protein